MARLYLRRTLSGFAPADEPSLETMRKYKVGNVFRADVTKPRSYQHHKLIMALLNLTYANQDMYDDFEMFRKAVAVAAGHVQELVTVDGEIIRLPRSINYDTLDEIEFTKVAGAMMTVCCRLLKGIGADELEAEVSKYADEHYGAEVA
jgi:hypothetical protein